MEKNEQTVKKGKFVLWDKDRNNRSVRAVLLVVFGKVMGSGLGSEVGGCEAKIFRVELFSFQEPFDVDEYIERLAWRTPGGGSKGGAEAFDPKRKDVNALEAVPDIKAAFNWLLEEFVNHIEELKMLDERIQRRVEKLEQQCQKEAKEFARKVQELQKSNQ
eukprot:g47523.t1